MKANNLHNMISSRLSLKTESTKILNKFNKIQNPPLSVIIKIILMLIQIKTFFSMKTLILIKK